MATLIVTKTDFDIDIPETCNACIFSTFYGGDDGDYKTRCLLLKSDEDDDYSELDVDVYGHTHTKCPRCPIISMNRDEA
jgi:hypothetical protein